MKILIDTNIFIHREDDDVVPKSLRKLEKTLRENNHKILIHPLSEKEIRNDGDVERRARNESRIETYERIGFPAYPTDDDSDFRQEVPEGQKINDVVDNAILYSVYDDLVDFLITEDRGIHKKALDIGLEERVFTIEEGWDFFSPDEPELYGPLSLERTTLGELDLSDPIFDSLKRDYSRFESWAQEKSERTSWVTYNTDRSLGALLVLKPNEVEALGASHSLGRSRRMKISTLKVAEHRWGSKIGELLVSISIREAVHHELDEIYLTYYDDGTDDYFVELIRSYGFEYAAEEKDGESVFLKRLTPGPGHNPDPIGITKNYYPSFYDGTEVDKYLTPIRPTYHDRLFTSYQNRQTSLVEFDGEFHTEGNAIKKAYLTGAKNYQIEPGDILLFYRSVDEKAVTSIGVCEEAYFNITDTDKIQKLVGKRSVFTADEIAERAESGTNVILFRWHFDLDECISYKNLLDSGVLSGPLQVMQGISEEDYEYIKEQGGLDGRFALD
ncbi:PIN domain-containing protein [Halorubrum aidingense]|uniref:PIN domain-containing protein n=1 Tax=Halorubrum aidingense TaxID=368623 RepID=UPI000A42EC79|nr:PIN domain-containing protein [Halorubrum aidingense]